MAKKIVLDTSEGFLVIMNPEQRKHAEALALPKLAQLLRKRLDEQTAVMNRMDAVVSLTRKTLESNDAETAEKVESLLWALDDCSHAIGDGLCEFGGYFEALIARSSERESELTASIRDKLSGLNPAQKSDLSPVAGTAKEDQALRQGAQGFKDIIKFIEFEPQRLAEAGTSAHTIVRELELSIRRNVIDAEPDHRDGYLRAMAESLAVTLYG